MNEKDRDLLQLRTMLDEKNTELDNLKLDNQKKSNQIAGLNARLNMLTA